MNNCKDTWGLPNNSENTSISLNGLIYISASVKLSRNNVCDEI